MSVDGTEALREDVRRAAGAGRRHVACVYFGHGAGECIGCPACRPGDCTQVMMEDICRRLEDMGGSDGRPGGAAARGPWADGGESVVGLLTDVDRAVSEFEGTYGDGGPSAFACGYFGKSYADTQCVDCPHIGGEGCSVEMMKDVRRRLHALMPHDADGAEMRPRDVIDDGYKHTVAGFRIVPTTVGGWVITTDPCECHVVQPDSWERLTEEAIEACPAAADLIARAKRLADSDDGGPMREAADDLRRPWAGRF